MSLELKVGDSSGVSWSGIETSEQLERVRAELNVWFDTIVPRQFDLCRAPEEEGSPFWSAE
jgi:hypothetical protein